MRITALKLSGFQSIKPDQPLELPDLGHRNVFIGPNNAGKSVLFRFLSSVTRHVLGLEEKHHGFVAKLRAPRGLTEQWFWGSAPKGHIAFSVSLDTSSLPNFGVPPKTSFVANGRSEICAYASGTDQGVFEWQRYNRKLTGR